MQRRTFSFGAASAALTLLTPSAWAQNQPQPQPKAGKEFRQLAKTAPTDAASGEVEVLEFFSYGCIHCKNFNPSFQAWKKAASAHVKVRMVHVGFNPNFEPLQRIFYTLQSMQALEQAHDAMFEAVLTERKAVHQMDVLLPLVAKLGIDRERFEAGYQSFSTASQVRRAIQLQNAYEVEGTPSIGVAGRYYTDGGMNGSMERLLHTVDYLVEQSRQA
ncbi:MAG: thiol:disulfide interchange protein DsbA/DsbL [Comamonas sp.]|nr:thiol:disulfide interchange protein DsbA/DsbL [Comamonas sp.]